MASASLLSATVSPYFSKGNFDKFLELKRAVNSACSDDYDPFIASTLAGASRKLELHEFEDQGSSRYDIGSHYTKELPDESDDDNSNSAGGGGGGEQPLPDITTRQPALSRSSNGAILNDSQNHSPVKVRWSSTAEKGAFLSDGSGRRNLQRLGSAFDSTVASRNKLRPEPRFQKAATSQLLSRVRQDSLLISKNPERFLEGVFKNPGSSSTSSLLDRRCDAFSAKQLRTSQSISSFLSTYVDKQSPTYKSYEGALQKLDQKRRQTKNRTLLISLGANPEVRNKLSGSSTSSTPGFQSPTSGSSSRLSQLSSRNPFFGGGDDQLDSSSSKGSGDASELLQYSPRNTDTILQTFLDELRCANVDNILSWVSTPATFKNEELPIGLPSAASLRLPTMNGANSSSPQSSKHLEFLKSATEEFFLLDAEYHAKLEELRGKIRDNVRELEMASWNSKDSALLFHLMSVTQSQSGSHFSSEKLCTEVATRIFPLHSRENIIAQKYRLKVKRALEEKLDSVLKHWHRDKENLVKKVNAAWDDIQKKQKAMEDFQQERKAQQEKCQYWVELLEKMRKENRKRIRQIQTLVEPLEEQMRHRQRLKEKHERGRRQEQKQVLDKLQKMRLDEEEEHNRRQEEIKATLEKDRKIRQIHNRTRVHLRKREFEMKMEHCRQLEKQREDDARRRRDVLEKTKEKVEINYSPTNILNDTHASLVRAHETQYAINLRSYGQGQDNDLPSSFSSPEEAAKFFQDRYSFSAETLWKDTRVRLEAKLREAGLIESSYARQVLLAMQPKSKPHLQSQIKFNNDE